MGNIKTLDFVFNRALNVANKYRNFEVGAFRRMMSALPTAKEGMMLSEWRNLAEQSKTQFLRGLHDSLGKFDASVNIASERELKRVISETTKLVDTHISAIKEQVPSFTPPLNPTDKFLFMKSMNDKSYNILQKMKNNTLLANSRIVPQYGDKFNRLISNTILKVNNGQSLQRAVGASVRELANNNISVITYSNGRMVSTKHYVEMSTRTELLNAHLETQKGRMQEYGLDLVQISEHYDCSELCLPWQGGVFSLSGGSDKYDSLDDAISGGLYHINCRHMQFPFVEGIADESVKIGKDELNKQRDARKQFRNNQNKIFKAQKNIAAKQHLSDAVVNTAKNNLAKAITDNNVLMQENDFLVSNLEVGMLDKIAIDSKGFSEELGVDSSFFQNYMKTDYKTIEKFVNSNIGKEGYEGLEYIQEEYLNGEHTFANSDMIYEYLNSINKYKVAKIIDTPLLNDQLFMESKTTNYALGTKFNATEKEQVMKAIEDMYKQNPELEGYFKDIRYYSELKGNNIGLYTHVSDVGYKEVNSYGGIVKYNKDGGIRTIKFTSLEKQRGKEISDEVIRTIKHEMYHGLDNMAWQLERSYKMERVMLENLEKLESMEVKIGKDAFGRTAIEKDAEFRRAMTDVLSDKTYIQIERKNGEMVFGDNEWSYKGFRVNGNGSEELGNAVDKWGNNFYSDKVNFKDKFIQYLEENGVEDPNVFIARNLSEYSLTDSGEMWAEVNSFMDTPVIADRMESLVPGIKDWIAEERISVREEIQQQMLKFQNHRKNFDVKEIEKRIQAQIKRHEDAIKEIEGILKADAEPEIDFSLVDEVGETAGEAPIVEEVVVPEIETVIPEAFPEVEQAEVEGNIYKTTRTFLKDQEWDYSKLSKEELETLKSYNQASNINLIRNLHYDPILDDTPEKIIKAERAYQAKRVEYANSKEFEERINKLFVDFPDPNIRAREMKDLFMEHGLNPQRISNTTGEGHYFIYELDEPEKVLKFTKKIMEERLQYTIEATEKSDKLGNFIYKSLEKLKNMDESLGKYELKTDTKAFRAMLNDDISLFFNDEKGIADFQIEFQELFKDLPEYGENSLDYLHRDAIFRGKEEFKKNLLNYMNMEPERLFNIYDMEGVSDETKQILNKVKEIQTKFKNRYVGNEFIDKGFHSTSLDDKLLNSKSSWPDYWKTKSNGMKREVDELIRIEVDIPKGAKGITLDKEMSAAVRNAGVDEEGLPIDTQKELLLQRNTRFKIKSIEKAPEDVKQQWVIKLEVING